MTANNSSVAGSFRDPSGFLFHRDGVLYRQVNQAYREHYDRLMASGLYEKLAARGLLIPHEEVGLENAQTADAYKVIKPRLVPFLSYPYEWCFSQLKDAALATLEIQKTAFECGMTLKDSSAYNVQFVDGKPVFIDTLSFEVYQEGRPWVAYRQFCQHFLAPLVLMSYTDIRLNQLFRIYIDGVPLDMASRLLPRRTYLRFSMLSHIHLHAKSQAHYADKAAKVSDRKMSRIGLQGLIDNLASAVGGLSWRPGGTEWGDYYGNTNYTDDALNHKRELVAEFLDLAKPSSVWDLGANTGLFSRIAAERGIRTIAFDIDPAAVEKGYRQISKDGVKNILPLLLDLTNPSPGIGWENNERSSLTERGPADTAFALALIHHLAISNNLPLPRIAAFFSRICNHLVIEFVPKEDSQVQRLLTTREDVFPHYNRESFEKAFAGCFSIVKSAEVRGTERTLYLMQKTGNQP